MVGYPNEFLINKDYSGNEALDYAFLRKRGIELIEQYSGQNWTDFNLHDPGVTILEYLCYSLTDLAYRTSFPIEKLVANEDGEIDRNANSFFEKKQILSTAPITAKDFRKFIIDAVPEIQNIWIEPALSAFANKSIKGQFEVTIQMQHIFTNTINENIEKTIVEKVRSLLFSQRNIAESYYGFTLLSPQRITINAQIIIGKNGTPEETLSQIYNQIEKALVIPINFYSEKELLNNGYKIEDIYKGPLLNNGILKDEELKEKTLSIDALVLNRVVLEINNVIHIKKFEIKSKGHIDLKQPLVLDKNHFPILSFDPLLPSIELFNDTLPIPLNTAVFERLLKSQRDSNRNYSDNASAASQTSEKLEGDYANLSEYVSLQTLFPAIYKIGIEGIEEQATPERKAKAKQLKGYLMFFEQILAGSLTQLSNLRNLFSSDIENHPFTYFCNPLYAVPGAEDIIKAFKESNGTWQTFINNPINEYVKNLQEITENKEDFFIRKKKILEHMLSRFNIIIDPYPLTLFNSCYNDPRIENDTLEELKWMSNILKNALDFNNCRNRAIDFYDNKNKESQKRGFASNIRLLLHINNHAHYTMQSLGKHIKRLSKRLQNITEAEISATVIIIKFDNEPDIQIDTTGYTPDKIINFEFNHQSIKLLVQGTKKENYKIIPAINNEKGWLIIFKIPEESYWQIVSRYPQKQDATTALKIFIQQLIDTSIDSEGFHIVEHILLAPPNISKVHGFKYYNDTGNLMLEQAEWLSFQERESTLIYLKKVAETTDFSNVDKLKNCLNEFHGRCMFQITNKEGKVIKETPLRSNQLLPKDINQILSILTESLKGFKKEQNQYYPRFDFQIKNQDEEPIDEKFFDSQITVVFSAWPKRFQNIGFREFTENTFNNNLPVHVKANFLWLGFSKMKIFEDLHQAWTKTFDDDVQLRENTSTAIRDFIFTEIKFVENNG